MGNEETQNASNDPRANLPNKSEPKSKSKAQRPKNKIPKLQTKTRKTKKFLLNAFTKMKRKRQLKVECEKIKCDGYFKKVQKKRSTAHQVPLLTTNGIGGKDSKKDANGIKEQNKDCNQNAEGVTHCKKNFKCKQKLWKYKVISHTKCTKEAENNYKR